MPWGLKLALGIVGTMTATVVSTAAGIMLNEGIGGGMMDYNQKQYEKKQMKAKQDIPVAKEVQTFSDEMHN